MNNMNQNGRSMIEMLGVLAIIGVLSVGGIAGYSKAMLKYKTNKTIDGITMLTTNIRTLYAQQKTFDGLDGVDSDNLPNSISMGVVPDELIKTNASGTYLGNPFAGKVTITVGNSVIGGAGTKRAFVIGVNGIPKEACMAIATSDWGSNYSSGLIGMALNSSYNATNDSGAASGALAEVYAGCPSGSTGASAARGALTTVEGSGGAICAKNMPISVAAAASACACDGSECSVAFKYY